MFDNLRDSASDSSFYEEDSNELYREPASRSAAASTPRRRETRFLGLTGQQRFLLTVMLFLTVCAFGTLAMFLLGKMSLF